MSKPNKRRFPREFRGKALNCEPPSTGAPRIQVPCSVAADTVTQRMSISAMTFFRGVLYYAEGGTLFFTDVSSKSENGKPIYQGSFKVLNRPHEICYLKFQDDIGSRDSAKRLRFLFVGTRSTGLVLSFRRSPNEPIIFVKHRGTVSQWTIAAHFIREPRTALVTLTAANQAIVWDFGHCLVKRKAWSCEKSHIMAGTMYGNSVKDLILFSGTFGAEVILWRVEEEEDNKIRILYRLKKHFGWLYSLTYYPEDGLLLSTSDDRTIIVWRFSYGSNHSYTIDDSIWLQTADYEVYFTFFAHKSKVLSAVLSNGKIISCGDDGKVCLWNSLGKLEKSWSMHRESPVLCLAVDSERSIVHSGAKNGSLGEVLLAVVDPIPQIRLSNVYVPGIDRPDFPRAVVIYDEIYCLVLMNSGIICSSSVAYGANLEILHICEEPLGKTVFGMTTGRQFLYVGYGRTLLLMRLLRCQKPISAVPNSPLKDTLEVVDKFDHFTFESAEKADSIMEYEIKPYTERTTKYKLIAKLEGIPTKISIPRNESLLGVFSLEEERILVNLTKSLHVVEMDFMGNSLSSDNSIESRRLRWNSKTIPFVTAAAECLGSNGFLVIGDDKGNIHAFSWTLRDYLFSFPSSGSSDAITYLETMSGDSTINVITSGRHCGYLTYYSTNYKQMTCHETKKVRIPFEFAEASYDFGTHGKVLVGFQSSEVLVYSLKYCTIILRIQCGGAHRSWDFFLDRQNGEALFIFLKDKVMYDCEVNVNNRFPKIRDGTHLATINCGVDLMPNNPGNLIATAGEDNIIHVSTVKQSVTGSNYELNLEYELAFHKSSVRALAYQEVSETLGYLISGGGRSELYLSRFERSVFSRRICCIDVMNPHRDLKDVINDSTSDVRVMDIASALRPMKKTKISRSKRLENLFAVFVACSSGTIRVFTSCDNNRGVLRLCAILETKLMDANDLKCQEWFEEPSEKYSWAVTRISVASAGNDNYRVFGVTSNGALFVWCLTIEDPPCDDDRFTISDYDKVPQVYAIHKIDILPRCAITALEVVEDESENGKFNIMTGSDNGKINFLKVCIDACDQVRLLESGWSQSGPHRSTIMCIKKSKGTEFYVSSVDQVLTKWDESGKFMFETLTGVTDCQALIVSDDRLFCLGNGISVLSPKKKTPEL